MALAIPWEFAPLIVLAIVCFVVPTVLGGLFVWWLWRVRRSAPRSDALEAGPEREADDTSDRRRRPPAA